MSSQHSESSHSSDESDIDNFAGHEIVPYLGPPPPIPPMHPPPPIPPHLISPPPPPPADWIPPPPGSPSVYGVVVGSKSCRMMTVVQRILEKKIALGAAASETASVADMPAAGRVYMEQCDFDELLLCALDSIEFDKGVTKRPKCRIAKSAPPLDPAAVITKMAKGGLSSGDEAGKPSLPPERDVAVVDAAAAEIHNGKGKGKCETPTYIARLPESVLTQILRKARVLEAGSRRRKSKSMPRQRLAFPFADELGTEVWLLKLSLVCKAWTDVVRKVAYSRLRLSVDGTLPKLLKAIKADSAIANAITDQAFFLDRGLLGLSKPPPAKGPTKSHEALIADLIRQAPNLKHVGIFVNDETEQNMPAPPPGFPPNHIRFMHHDLHGALCGSSLTSLVVEVYMIYADLEMLLNKSNTLKKLKIGAGLDNMDGRDDISDARHSAPLETVDITSHRGRLGSRQLCWILGPAVTTLKQLVLHLPTPMNHGPPGHDSSDEEAGPQQPTSHPCATVQFANILMETAPRLTLLELKSSHREPTTALTLMAEPHNGNLDYALGHCTNLRSCIVDYGFVGNRLYESLGAASKLRFLSLLGMPRPGTAPISELTACIEDGRLAELKTVFISRRNTVNAKDLRYLMTLCQEKGIKCRI